MNIPYVWNDIYIGDGLIVAGFLAAGWLLVHFGYRDGYKQAHREADRARRLGGDR